MIHTAKQLKDKVRNQSCGNSRVVWLRRVNQEIQPYTRHLIASHAGKSGREIQSNKRISG